MEETTFLSLGDVLILQIYEELNASCNIPTTSLPLVSKYLRNLLFPSQMRTLRLWDHSDGGLPTAMERRNELLLREGSGSHPNVKAIREVCVEGCHGDEEGVETQELICILGRRVGFLNSFVWNSPKQFPPEVAALLAEKWPNIKLSVVTTRTTDKDSRDFWEVDDILLGSELLHALDVDLHWSWVHTDISRRRYFSQLGRVIRLLGEEEGCLRDGRVEVVKQKKKKRLRNLKIGFDGKRSHGYPGCVHVPPCFLRDVETPQDFLMDPEGIQGSEVRFEKGFRLDALVKMVRPVKDLGLESKAFLEALTNMLFVELGRREWVNGLRYLELHGLSTKLPFAELKGRVPALRFVEVVLDGGNLRDGLTFLEGLQWVQELSVVMEGGCLGVEEVDVGNIWDVVAKQRSTLRNLVLHTKLGISGEQDRFVLRRQHVAELGAGFFEKLEHLEMDITLRDAIWLANLNGNSTPTVESSTTVVKEKKLIAPLLMYLSSIRTLRLLVNLQGQESRFHSLATPSPDSDEYGRRRDPRLPALHLKCVRDCLVYIPRQIFYNDSEARLEKAEVVWMFREAKWEEVEAAERNWNVHEWKGEIYGRETAAMMVPEGRIGKGKWGMEMWERVGGRECRLFGMGDDEFDEGWLREERVLSSVFNSQTGVGGAYRRRTRNR